MALQRPCHLLRAPVRMSMRSLDELRTSSDGLWGPMGLDQQLQLTELIGSQEQRTLGALMRQTAPPWKRDTTTPGHALSRTRHAELSIPASTTLRSWERQSGHCSWLLLSPRINRTIPGMLSVMNPPMEPLWKSMASVSTSKRPFSMRNRGGFNCKPVNLLLPKHWS